MLSFVLLASGFWLLAPPNSYAQLSEEELRRERLEAIEELQRTEKSWQDYRRGAGWKFNFGSWISTSYMATDNDDRDVSTQDLLDHTWDNDIRLFAAGRSGDGKTQFYVRTGTNYTTNSRTTTAIRKRDWVQPSIEMMYVGRSFGTKAFKHTLTAGRQFVSVKNSLAFAMVADGLNYELKTRRQSFEAFAVRQPPGDNNIDYLAPGPGRTKRWFAGTQYDLNYIGAQKLNLFAVWNKDANNDDPDATGQRHLLDSLYLGLTFDGTIFERLKYDLQYIQELGKTYSDSSPTNASPESKVDISAQAVHAALAYYFSGTLNLMVHVDYLYGSGDADAVGNVVSTDGGSGSLNNSGSGGKDRRFMSFGGKNLGFALAPTLSNLHVIKSGFSLKPFGWSENRLWSNFNIHPDVFIYKRDKAAGATSDPYMVRGAGASDNVGHEFDVTFSWRLMSDMKYNLKIGKFYPGSAYLTKSSETLIRMKISVDL